MPTRAERPNKRRPAKGRGRNREAVQLDTDVYTLAVQRMRRAYEQFDHIAVAFSGGKDSTACLEIALTVAEEQPNTRLPLHVIHFDEEVYSDETHRYVARRAQDPRINLDWYCLPVKHQNACSREHAWWFPWDPDVPHLWTRPMPDSAITELPGFPEQPAEARYNIPQTNGLMFPADKYGLTGLVLGIRTQESLSRYRSVVRGGNNQEHWIKLYDGGVSGNSENAAPHHGNIRKLYPIYDWQTEDLWYAVTHFGWDYNDSYDRMHMHGLPPHAQRIAPPFHPEAIGTLDMWAACFPEVWDRMVDRVPGAQAARHLAKTELYNYGNKRTLKRNDITWEEYIHELLAQFPDDLRKGMARRVKQEIRHHYHVTDDPILEETPHPRTGISWRFIHDLASRGDPMSRRIATANIKINHDDKQRQIAAWNDERQRMLDEGRLHPHKRSGNLKMADDSLDHIEHDAAPDLSAQGVTREFE